MSLNCVFTHCCRWWCKLEPPPGVKTFKLGGRGGMLKGRLSLMAAVSVREWITCFLISKPLTVRAAMLENSQGESELVQAKAAIHSLNRYNPTSCLKWPKINSVEPLGLTVYWTFIKSFFRYITVRNVIHSWLVGVLLRRNTYECHVCLVPPQQWHFK